MQEHNFEKQVQQLMDELSIAPSAPVWQKVEEEIRKKKDRRRLVFWLVPLLLICGGTSLWLLTTVDRPNIAITDTKQESRENLKKKEPTHIGTPASQVEVPKSITDEQGTVLEPTTSLTPGDKNMEGPRVLPRVAPASQLNSQSEDLAHEFTRRPVREVTDSKLLADTSTALSLIVSEDQTSSKQDSLVSANEGQSADQSLKNKEEVNEQTDPEAAAKVVTKNRLEKEWQWNVHASAGISSVKRGLFHSNTMSLDYYQAPQNGGMTSTPPPSEVRKGTSLSFGVDIKRNMSSRLSLTGGLQYRLYSTLMATGAHVNRDTVVSNSFASRNISSFYQTGGQKEYRNDYHFIELPLGIEYQLFRQLPIQLHTGIVLGQLISTNALVYDARNNIYYKDNSMLNKTQLQLFTNLTYQVLEKRNYSLHIGPYLQYGFHGLEKEEQGNRHHLFSTGLRTQVSF